MDRSLGDTSSKDFGEERKVGVGTVVCDDSGQGFFS